MVFSTTLRSHLDYLSSIGIHICISIILSLDIALGIILFIDQQHKCDLLREAGLPATILLCVLLLGFSAALMFLGVRDVVARRARRRQDVVQAGHG
ncbi:hypothetical protein P154DRAFT_563986, partial [Amniculicola lignicola CBS 123094]